MKTKTLFLLLLLPLLCYNNVQAQEDVFPRDSAIWVIHMYNPYGVETEFSRIQLIYGLQGDTLINDITYQCLYWMNDTTLNISEGDVFVAGIRQEYQKVYVQPADKKDGSKFEEFLLYDFSANVGDTVFFGKKPMELTNPTFEYEDPIWLRDHYAIIVSIENREYGESFRTDWGQEWIRYIGSLDGLFFPGLRFNTGGGGADGCQLICMKYKDELKYLGENCTSCFEEKFHYESGNIEKEHTQKLAEVSFNSSLNNIIIKSFAIPSTFQLVSVDGKLLTAFPINETEVNINASTYPKGVYIYKIVGENIFQSGKLIIK